MTKIDSTFLNPHPRTVLWNEQRKLCEVCVNVVRKDEEVRCQLASAGTQRVEAPMRSRKLHIYCIDAREPGQPCGPTGDLFERSVLADPTPDNEN